jgi:hydroxymethylglutaryl-CoA reductase
VKRSDEREANRREPARSAATVEISSRLSGFYKRSPEERLAAICAMGVFDDDCRQHLGAGGGLELGVADKMSENVIAIHGLPLSVALNFRVNERDVLVPMAVEEPSIVAAASNAARMVRLSGGFFGDADPPLMTAQVQLDDVPDAERAAERVRAHRQALLAAGDASIPRMVERGGGCRDLDVRVLDAAAGVLVVHVYVDVGDAMGANMVDTVAEALADEVHALTGGHVGLRILSNLSLRRRVRVRASVSAEAVGGEAVADGIARASRFAELDPCRAATHNKGFMNGLDAAAVALGQDWRAIEAGAHAFAGLEGRYRPLSTWRRTADGLVGHAELPLAVGTVGGSTQVHPGVRAAMAMVRAAGARELAVVLASAGLAANLAALRALAGEGIQKGHMRLHERKLEVPLEAPAAAGGGEALLSASVAAGGQ